MKIKDVEKRTGITSYNIRFYEKENLLIPKRNPVNGYREYTEEDILLLNRIKMLRMLDIPVSDIRKILYEKEKAEILAIEDEDKRQEEMDKLNATKEEWKLRAMGTTIGCHTIVKKGTEGNCLSFHATITPYRRKYPDLLIRFLFS